MPEPRLLPTGTVTFLFTDIEGSTKRWETNSPAMQAAFARQEAILRHAIGDNSGYAYKMIGDAFQAAFPTAPQALQAAIDAQRALHSEPWPQETGEVRVRMALHAGTTEERGDDYVGPALNRVARLLSAGHGGQILLSEPAFSLARDTLPTGVTMLDMGEHRLKDLIRPEHIFQVVVADLPSEFPQLITLDAHPNNLPMQPTPLIGRQKELAQIEKLLAGDDVRLLTLIGPGGMGKTRLALQAAADVLHTFSNGVFFVTLATITEANLVAATVAQTLGVRDAGGQSLLETLKEYLRDKYILLVLDNFEQVAEAAPLVSDLLQTSPKLKALVTSRSVLHLRGEKIFPVPPLSLPDLKHLPTFDRLNEYEAIRLFTQRAGDAKPEFQLTGDNALAVVEICSRLDGLPLAIELAAARVKILTPQAILARLQSSLKLLTGGALDLPARQQTLRNTIEWSYDLLEGSEKKLLRRMSVFAGCTLEAIETVCNPQADLEMDVLDGVGSLVDKSLLRQELGTVTAVTAVTAMEPRFFMLETIREYARERLQESGEAEEIRQRHADFFLALAEEAGPALLGPDQAESLKRIKGEYDNMRAVLGWCLGEAAGDGGIRDAETGTRLAMALHFAWYVLGYLAEGREWFDKALVGTREMENSWTRATVLWGAGALAMWQDDVVPARRWLEESTTIWRELGSKEDLAKSLFMLGVTAVKQGEELAANSSLEECLLLLQELGEQSSAYYLIALIHLGDVALDQANFTQACSRYEEALALNRETGYAWGIAQAVNNLGEVARCEGDYIRAGSLYNESKALFKEAGSPSDIVRSIHNLGYVAFHEGDYRWAGELFKESLMLFKEQSNRRGMAECLVGLAGVAGARDLGGLGLGGLKATRLLAVAKRWFEVSSAAMWPPDRIEYERNLSSARTQLGEEEFKRAWEEGLAMSMERAVEYALDSDSS